MLSRPMYEKRVDKLAGNWGKGMRRKEIWLTRWQGWRGWLVGKRTVSGNSRLFFCMWCVWRKKEKIVGVADSGLSKPEGSKSPDVWKICVISLFPDCSRFCMANGKITQKFTADLGIFGQLPTTIPKIKRSGRIEFPLTLFSNYKFLLSLWTLLNILYSDVAIRVVTGLWSRLINPRNNPARHTFPILLPILTILDMALVIVSTFTMNQEDLPH